MSNVINGQYTPKANISGSVQIPQWVKGTDGYTPVKGVDYWTDEELQATYDYLVQRVSNINFDDIDIDMTDVIEALKQELAAVSFSNDYNDLDNKPTIPSTVGLATEAYVDNKVANIDLANYVLKSALNKVATSGKYSDLSGVPTKLSQFTNDAGYLTQHQSLTDYAKKSYVDNKIANIQTGGNVDLTEYSKTSEFAEVAFSGDYNDLDNLPEIPEAYNDAAVQIRLLALESKEDKDTVYDDTEIRNLIAGKQDAGSYLVANDLANFYSKSEVEGLIAAVPKFKIQVEEVRPVSGDATTVYLIPSTDVDTDNMYVEYIYVNGSWEKLGVQKFDLTGYATESWVEGKGYLTEHQSLVNYALKSEIPDVSAYQTAEQVQAAITTALGNIGIAEEGTY